MEPSAEQVGLYVEAATVAWLRFIAEMKSKLAERGSELGTHEELLMMGAFKSGFWDGGAYAASHFQNVMKES